MRSDHSFKQEIKCNASKKYAIEQGICFLKINGFSSLNLIINKLQTNVKATYIILNPKNQQHINIQSAN